ncbi:MAG: hypothetical protein ACI9GM_000569 [Salibacteraceae bacterium]|jgi:hypothetical protein
MNTYHAQLFEENILDGSQHQLLDEIEKEESVSVYFETRSLLYIGVLLLTSGIGLLIYQNLGQVAHLALIALLVTLEGICFWYIQKQLPPYSNTKQKAPNPYFDYVVLLAALLVISIFTYVLIQFELLEGYLQWSSIVTAFLFFFIAFRFDHKGVLALAITAFCAFWGLTISPMNWVSFEFEEYRSLYLSGIFIGAFFVGSGFLLEFRNIKKHFKFTFQNLGLLVFYVGLLIAQIESDKWLIYSLLGVVLSIAICIYFWKQREYLLFVYGVIAGYFSFTRWFIEVANKVNVEAWLLYIIVSMGGFVFLIERIINAQRKTKRNDSI